MNTSLCVCAVCYTETHSEPAGGGVSSGGNCFFFVFFKCFLSELRQSLQPGSHRTPPVCMSIWCPHIELCGLSVRACGCWFCAFFWQTCWCNWHDAIIQQAWTVSKVVILFFPPFLLCSFAKADLLQLTVTLVLMNLLIVCGLGFF